MNHTFWKPSFRWHARSFGVILVICLIFFTIGFLVISKLPPPYQSRTPNPQAIPWKAQISEDL